MQKQDGGIGMCTDGLHSNTELRRLITTRTTPMFMFYVIYPENKARHNYPG